MISLYPDQAELLDKLRAALSRHQSILLYAAPGFGKTVTAAKMLHGANEKRKRAVFLCHRKELLRQTAKTLSRFGIPYGYIAAGHSPNPFANVHVATIGTLKNRLERWDFDLVIHDEAHISGSPTSEKILNHYRKRGAKIVGLTGSPERSDGKSLATLYDDMVSGPSPAWLIEHGRLARYRAYAPVKADLKGLPKRGGDYATDALEDRFDKPSIIGDLVRSWGQYGRGRRTAIYCFSIAHSKHVAETFKANGIPVEHMDGTTPDTDRVRIIRDFAHGRIIGISSCELMTTGFDLSSQVDMDVPIQCGVYARPTQSTPLAIQMLMRPMRAQEGEAVLLDHVNLFASHGLPDDDREWNWRGREGGKSGSGGGVVATCTCPSCFAVYRPAPSCPQCGAVRMVEGRKVDQVEGDLAEIDIIEMRKHREFIGQKIEERECKSLEDWRALAKKRGFKDGWAWHRWQAKQKKGVIA